MEVVGIFLWFFYVFEMDTEFLPVICWLSKNQKAKQWSKANEAVKDLKQEWIATTTKKSPAPICEE